MKLGVIQSNYIPWRGYFDFIDSVDLFVIYDDIQYSKGSWRNRNLLKTNAGLKWITVPVKFKIGLLIEEVLISNSTPTWQDTHRALLKKYLEPAPFFKDAMEIWEEGISVTLQKAKDPYISQLNICLIKLICKYLKINTPIVMSSEYPVVGSKTIRLINLLKELGATSYLSGPTAKDYMDEDLFRENGVRLEYKTYDYPSYPQLWGDFIGNVTVLDLIANTGPDARSFLKSQTPNIVEIE